MFCKDKESFYEINARIDRYIAFYNTERPCSVLNNLSPQNSGIKIIQTKQASVKRPARKQRGKVAVSSLAC
jgi:hypothetical protein